MEHFKLELSFSIEAATLDYLKSLQNNGNQVILNKLTTIMEKIDKMSKETTDLLTKMNDATNAVAARLQKLIDASNDPALNQALQAEVDRLTALAADPANPVP